VTVDFTEFKTAVRKKMQENSISFNSLCEALGNTMPNRYLFDSKQPAIPSFRDYEIIRDFVGLGDVFDHLFKAQADREVIGQKSKGELKAKGILSSDTTYEKLGRTIGYGDFDITKPSTPEAQQWQGWGTALKPAFEPVIVARKPIEGTVANNVLKWGTGGLNIDGSRIGTESVKINTFDNGAKPFGDAVGEPYTSKQSTGRWPANIILDPYTAELLDEQSGTSTSKSGSMKVPDIRGGKYGSDYGTREFDSVRGHNDSVGASRFFYVAKASKRDRNEGLEELDAQRHSDRELDDGVGGDNPRNRTNQAKQNFHPTVKPTALMEYLIKLVTPPGGTVLDPFTGSGSTGKAAILQGFDFIGIEMTEDYWPIIEGRLIHAEAKVAERIKETIDQEQEKLF
jgi:site-specific DNA-methyltransferase (adenine-specific)